MTVSADFVGRLESPLAAFGIARVEALAELPGNPLQLQIERFGEAVAPAAPAEPELDFVNRITRLGPREADQLGEILSFYSGLGLRPWLEVQPGLELVLPAESALLGFRSVLHGPARRDLEARLAVRETDDLAGTARLILEAFGVPAEIVERNGGALANATRRSGGRAYVVDADGRPVAGGILTVRDRIGYLAMAGTLPDFRGRGCQSALIAARIRAAATARCETVVATTEFASASERNIARAGLSVAYTKPVLRLGVDR